MKRRSFWFRYLDPMACKECKKRPLPSIERQTRPTQVTWLCMEHTKSKYLPQRQIRLRTGLTVKLPTAVDLKKIVLPTKLGK